MGSEDILACQPRVLAQAQREHYFEQGYLLVPEVIPPEWLERLRAVTEEMVDRSRRLAESDAIFDLEPGHTPDNPRLRRLSNPVSIWRTAARRWPR